MTIAAGTEVYNVDADPVLARGLEYSVNDLNDALNGPVRAVFEDDHGQSRIKSLLDSVARTDFEKGQLAAILDEEPEPEDWRVGEAFAEVYLTDHRQCSFPWPDRWDERRRRSSLPGADLVGFEETDHVTLPFRFAFGEVKTSSEERTTQQGTPQSPQVAYGVRDQLRYLRDSKSVRDALFQYLAHRAVNADWQPTFQSAARRYFSDDTDIAIFGVLIRDVTPYDTDLKNHATTLADTSPVAMRVELLAIYIPRGSIARFADHFKSREEGNDAD